MPRPTKTDLEVEHVRGRVCDAAEALFSRDGMENVGLRAIGSAIGLTGAALYRYFPQGRDEILAAIRARAFRELADLSEEAVASCGTPLERLRAVAEAYVGFAGQDAASYRLLFSGMQAGDFPELRKEARRAREVLFRVAQEAAHSDESSEQGRVWAHVAWAAIHGAVMLETSDMLRMGVDINQLVDGVAHALSHLNGTFDESGSTTGRSKPARKPSRK
jgi:AcrR family transcriptional regulator